MTIQRYGLQQIKHPEQSYGIICPDVAGDYVTHRDYAEAIRKCQESCIAAGYEQGRKEHDEPRWIPCSERLPVPGVEVAGLDGYGALRYIAKRSEHCHNWMVQVDDGFSAWGSITHWMPLPAPPVVTG